jgi:histidinol-phosphate aminotransferase
VALIAEITSAVGGAGTSVVYGWPSFVMYRFAAIWAGASFREVPLNAEFELDLEGLADAIDADTRVVFLCNPNNPTGTIKPADQIDAFARSVPPHVLVVIDEAYHDYVTDARYHTAIPLAVELGNVVVLRTFSKVFALAAHRIGYAVGRAETLVELRKVQVPLVVSRVAQAAAMASLGQPAEVARRVELNAAGRHHVSGALTERRLIHVESHANFIYFKMPGDDSGSVSDEFTKRGVIIRPMSRGWMRVSIGSGDDNRRFIETLDEVLSLDLG